MTMLNFAPRNSVIAPSIRRAAGSFFRRLGRLINRWIAAEIARRERQAAIVALRQLSDRELKDIGLTRGEIGVGLAKAASMCGNGGEGFG